MVVNGTVILKTSTAAGTGTISNFGKTLKLDNSGTGQNILLTNTFSANGATLINTAGDNKVTSNLSINSGFSNHNYQVDGGTLELAGNYGAGTTGRTVFLKGVGTGLYSGNLTFGNNAVTKQDPGTWILSGANTYTGATTVSAGTLVARSGSALGTSSTANVTVSANANLSYAAASNTALNIGGTLAITGGASTTIGGSIGSTATSAQINVTGNATATSTVKVNVFGISGVTPLSGTNTFTLIKGNGATNTLNGATYSLGTVYNNTNFTVGTPSATATDLSVPITSQTALTSAFWIGGLTAAANIWAASNGSTQSNWTATSGGGNQALVPGSGSDVTISNSSVTTAPTATTLGADMTIKTLTIADTTNGLGLNADGYTLTITPSASTDGILVNASVPASTLSAKLKLGATQTWTNNSGNTLTINGPVTNGAFGLTVAGSGNTLINGAIGSGAGTLTKIGAGKLTLSGTNTYTGATTISAGTLQVGVSGTGSTASGSAVSVNGSTAVLAGSGTINGATTLNLGTLKPGDSAGDSVGTLNFNSLTYLGGKTEIQISGGLDTSANRDHINVTNALTLSNGSNFNISFSGFTPLSGTSYTWDILDWGSLTQGGFSAGTDGGMGGTNGNFVLPDISGVTGSTWTTSSFLTNGQISIVSNVPEPSRMILLFVGIAALFMRRRRS